MRPATPDEQTQSWYSVSELVLAGTYDHTSLDTLKSLEIGLRSIPECAPAAEHVRELIQKRKKR